MRLSLTKSVIAAFLFLTSASQLCAQADADIAAPDSGSSRLYVQYGNLLGLGAGGVYSLSPVSAVEVSLGFNPFVYVVLGPPFDGNLLNVDAQLRLQTPDENPRIYVAAGGYLGTFDVLSIAVIAGPKMSIGFENYSDPHVGCELGAAINLPVQISGEQDQIEGGTLHKARVREKYAGTFFPYFKLKIIL